MVRSQICWGSPPVVVQVVHHLGSKSQIKSLALERRIGRHAVATERGELAPGVEQGNVGKPGKDGQQPLFCSQITILVLTVRNATRRATPRQPVLGFVETKAQRFLVGGSL